jgi:hypothetical protein
MNDADKPRAEVLREALAESMRMNGDRQRRCMRPRYWLSRLVIALEVFIAVVIVSWFEDASLTSKAIEETGRFGWTLIAALFVCCAIALADVLVNDVMPKRYVLPTAIHFRNLGFMGMAILLGMLGVLVVYSHGYTPLVFVYWLNASLAAGVSFFDLFARYRP